MAVAAPAAATQQQGKVRFRYGTRQRVRPVTTVPVLSGGVTAPPIEIKQVGFLDAIDLSIRSPSGVGLVQGASAATLQGNRLNIASHINRLQVALNTGAAVIVDVTGEQLALINHFIEGSYGPWNALQDNASPLGGSGGLPPTSATTPLNWNVRVPIAANNGTDFTSGLLMLQSQQVLCQVNISWNLLSAIYATNAPAFTATTPSLDVAAVTYAAPDPSKVQLPLPSLHRLLETTYPIVNNGDVIFRLPREGILLRLYMILVINGALDNPGASALTNVRIRLNDVDEPYNVTRQWIEAEMMRHVGSMGGFPFWGGYVLDFWNSQKIVAGGDARDAFDTEKFSTFEVIINIPSSITPGANSYMSICREIIQYPRRTA